MYPPFVYLRDVRSCVPAPFECLYTGLLAFAYIPVTAPALRAAREQLSGLTTFDSLGEGWTCLIVKRLSCSNANYSEYSAPHPLHLRCQSPHQARSDALRWAVPETILVALNRGILESQGIAEPALEEVLPPIPRFCGSRFWPRTGALIS